MALLAKCRKLCELFGDSRPPGYRTPLIPVLRGPLGQEFTVETDRVTVDEKRIQLEENETVGL